MTTPQDSSKEGYLPATFDAVVIGAGFAGLYMLHRLRDRMGLSVRVYEAGDGVGGTWYWNRYPGARCDSDSYIYCYTFDKQLLQEWEWSERYPEQPEILRYLNHVADRFELKRDIQFATRVTEASFNEQANRWEIRTDRDNTVSTRFLIAGVGLLSDANLPNFKGLETFEGKWYHTSRWPQGGADFTAKRVAVVGTGATAVQAIPEIAQQAKHLTVFQRTPAYCVPARNGKVDPEGVKARKANYDRIVENIKNSFFGFEFDFIENRRSMLRRRSVNANSMGAGTRVVLASGWLTTRTCSSTKRRTSSALTTSSERFGPR
jgi:cyclohexanone monooxygenase